jgi:hypothetical protein
MEDEHDEDEQQEAQQKKPATHDEARSVDMQRVTAYVEDVEMSTRNIDDVRLPFDFH